MPKAFTLHTKRHNCSLENTGLSWGHKGSTELSSIASFSAPTTLEGRNQKNKIFPPSPLHPTHTHTPPNIFLVQSVSLTEHSFFRYTTSVQDVQERWLSG